MSSSLFLKQSPICFIRLIWMVFMMGGSWPYGCCFVGCCLKDLFCGFLALLPSSFFSIRLVSVHVVYPYSNIDTTAAGKKLCFILSDRSNFHMTNSISIVFHAFASRISMAFSVDETLLKSMWICPQVTETYHLEWRCRLFGKSTWTLFCLRSNVGILKSEFATGEWP